MVYRRVLRRLRRRRQRIHRRVEPLGIFHAGSRRSQSEAQVQPQQLRRRVGGGQLQRRKRQGRKAADGEVLPGGRGSLICALGSAGGRAVTVQEGRAVNYRLGESRAFEGGGSRFLYLVPSAGIFELDEASTAVLRRLEQGEATREELAAIADQDVIDELYHAHAITTD